MATAYTMTAEPRASSTSQNLWLYNRNWDLTFISLSAVLVALPIVTYLGANQMASTLNSLFRSIGLSFVWDDDASRNLVNGMIAFFVGGPHMYATYTRTALDNDFKKQHPMFLLVSLLIPIGVIYFGVKHFQILLTFFFFWASVHILHQIIYIMECYNKKAGRSLTLSARLTDYAVVLTSMYPIATYKFVHNQFHIGQTQLLFPDFLKSDYLFYFVTSVFAASFIMFTAKTIREIRGGYAHYPKILLMYLTVIVAFFIPAYSNLDVSFQGFNTWHSFQYLGLTYYINRLRQEKHAIHTPLIEKISGEGKTWRYYFFNVGLTVGAIGIIALLISFRTALGLTFDQCYYIVVLSFLLTHYFHDHLLFTQPEAILS